VWRRITACFLLLATCAPGPAAARPADEASALYPPRLKTTVPRPPWPRRRRVGVKGMRGKGQGLVDLKRWPAEPSSPQPVEPERLARALRELCASWMPPRRPLRYAGWIIQYSDEFGVDPFLLAALIYRQSRCVPTDENDYGVGLAMINARMHGGSIHRRRYRYWTLEQGKWQRHELPIKRYALVPGNLRRARPSIYFAAALLSVWKRQCPAIDGAFGSVPHRHYVSHFIWGDRVKGAGAEDRVLRARRRLIAYYLQRPQPVLGEHGGVGCAARWTGRRARSRAAWARSGPTAVDATRASTSPRPGASRCAPWRTGRWCSPGSTARRAAPSTWRRRRRPRSNAPPWGRGGCS
jgi:hypothetical protein